MQLKIGIGFITIAAIVLGVIVYSTNKKLKAAQSENKTLKELAAAAPVV